MRLVIDYSTLYFHKTPLVSRVHYNLYYVDQEVSDTAVEFVIIDEEYESFINVSLEKIRYQGDII